MKQLVMIFLMCLQVSNLQKSHFMHILQLKDNIFDTMNSSIFTTMNKLLSSLNIDKDFTNSVNVQMLMIMSFHYYKITEKTYEVYKELKNVSAANLNISNNINLNEIFIDILKDNIANIENNISNITNYLFEPEATNNKTENNSTEDAVEYFNDFWSKLSDRTIESLIDPILNETEITSNAEHSFYASNKLRELKAWKPSTADELDITNKTRRIYKGKKAKIKSYPFLVSIHIMSEFMCAGSIISKDMVITAASCLQIAYKNNMYRDNPRSIFVRVASDYTKRSGELIPIVKVIFHPQYDPRTLKNNLAIIQMLENIKHIKKRKIKRIKYDRRAEGLVDDRTEVTILGWGAKDEKHLKASNFQKLTVADLDLYDINDCKEVYSKYYVTDTNFCAGFTYKGGGACMGDVGGPAVVSGELVGLISFGPTVCGLPDAPTVFTKLGYYAQWIDEILTQKPIPRQKDRRHTTNKLISPNLFILPLYTTSTQSHVSIAQQQVTKRKMRATPKIPDEVQFLKKIIHDYILANSSVVDYLLNGDILEDEEVVKANTEESNLFMKPKIYKAQETGITKKFHPKMYRPSIPVQIQPVDTTETYNYITTSFRTIRYSLPKIRATSTLKHEFTTPSLLSDYGDTDNLRKKTTFKTFYDNSGYSNEGERVDSNQKVSHGGEESSSYYEEGIPIEATENKSDFKNEEDSNISLVKQWQITTKLMTNNEFKTSKAQDNYQNIELDHGLTYVENRNVKNSKRVHSEEEKYHNNFNKINYKGNENDNTKKRIKFVENKNVYDYNRIYNKENYDHNKNSMLNSSRNKNSYFNKIIPYEENDNKDESIKKKEIIDTNKRISYKENKKYNNYKTKDNKNDNEDESINKKELIDNNKRISYKENKKYNNYKTKENKNDEMKNYKENFNDNNDKKINSDENNNNRIIFIENKNSNAQKRINSKENKNSYQYNNIISAENKNINKHISINLAEKKNIRINSEEVLKDDDPTTLIPWPAGVTMSISDDDFEYMDIDKKEREMPKFDNHALSIEVEHEMKRENQDDNNNRIRINPNF